MSKRSFLQIISSYANWQVPDHTDVFDLEFDEHHSLRFALAPTWSDPLIWILSVAHLLAYGYFAYGVVLLFGSIYSGLATGFSHFFVAALALQVVWAAKAVYLLDKASGRRHRCPVIWRVARTAMLGLPFSFAPAWIMGCLAWPILRINVSGGQTFYDQSVMVGQFVQNTLWYIGARDGSLRDNITAFAGVAIGNRSRYWDAASEQTVLSLLGLVVAMPVFYLLLLLGGGFTPLPQQITVLFPGVGAILFVALLSAGMVFCIVNTTGLGAISILEYMRTEKQISPEDDLPPDGASRWLLYVPHALVGLLIYLAALLVIIGPLKSALHPLPIP